MKLGDFFIKLGVKGDVKELDKTISKLEKANKRQREVIKYRKELAKATTQEEKALVKRNFADKIRLDNLRKQREALKTQNAEWLGLVKGVGAFVAAATIAYKVVDRMVSSLAQANQQMISFQRQTGISFASLNKYASANAAVNFNSSIEGTAQSMQRLAQNLWNIQMGRGDVSPYQELAFVGGKAFNPYGMSVEQVIENVREAIKGVGDIQATNIITRMGFAPDDLLMLRMGREEFEKINDLFLDKESREELNKFSLELKKVKLSLDLAFQKYQLLLIKEFGQVFIDILSTVNKLVIAYQNYVEWANNSSEGTKILLLTLKTLLAPIKMLYLIIDDIATYFAGGNSLLGIGLAGIQLFIQNINDSIKNSKIMMFFDGIRNGIKSLISMKIPNWLQNLFNFAGNINPFGNFNLIPPTNSNGLSYGGNNINTNNSFSITTQQPIDVVANNLINRFTPIQAQFNTVVA